MDLKALEYFRKHSCGFSRSRSHNHDRDNSTLGQAGEDTLWHPQADLASCATLEISLKKERELTGLPGFIPSQELQEKLRRKLQATLPAIPMPALKRPCKRKGAILKHFLPPSRHPPSPALLQLLCDQQELPPPPKIPRTDAQRESDTIKNRKHQAIQILDEKVNVLQPKTQVEASGTAPQAILPRSPSASVSTVSGVSSLGRPASTPLLCKASRPPIPSVPSPSLKPSIPTIPFSSSALPSDSLTACQVRPCVETPPDAKKKDLTDLATALAPGISHLPRPGPLSFNPPSYRRESAGSVCTASHPPVPFSAVPLSPFPRNPPTVFSTSASNTYEDMYWEPSPWPEEMDMDTTPSSEAAILSSPTAHSMAATIPSRVAKDFELMDTIPPSKAVLLHSSPGTSHASNSLPLWSMWRPTTACHHGRVQSSHTLLNEQKSNGCVYIKKPFPATAAVGLPSQSASGSKPQSRFADSASPADHGRPSGMKQANEKCPTASYIAKSTLGHALKTGIGTRPCNSSTNITPSTPTSVRSVVPVIGENHAHGMAMQRCMAAPRNPIPGGKSKGNRGPVEPVFCIVYCLPKNNSDPVKMRTGRQ